MSVLMNCSSVIFADTVTAPQLPFDEIINKLILID